MKPDPPVDQNCAHRPLLAFDVTLRARADSIAWYSMHCNSSNPDRFRGNPAFTRLGRDHLRRGHATTPWRCVPSLEIPSSTTSPDSSTLGQAFLPCQHQAEYGGDEIARMAS